MEPCPHPLTDEQIIELYLQRNETALRETEKRYGKLLFGIAYGILHDRFDAEECQNDTLFRVWGRIPPEKPKVFSAFLSKITRDLAIDRYRQKTRQKRIPSEMTVALDDLCDTLKSEDSPENAVLAQELALLISDYLRILPARRRYIFIERYYLFTTMEQIARDVGIGIATVHRECETIKQGLKAHLEKNGVLI